jgi:hypothetical protein
MGLFLDPNAVFQIKYALTLSVPNEQPAGDFAVYENEPIPTQPIRRDRLEKDSSTSPLNRTPQSN